VADIAEAVGRIRAWGEARDWRGYDPYDGLNSPLARRLPTRSTRRLLTQAVKLSPLNLRPLLRIKPAWNPKAVALVASAYARLGEYVDAQRWLEWLHVNQAETGKNEAAWGYNFPVETRFFAYPSGAPNTIATSFAAQALLDGYELLGDTRWAAPARAAATYLESKMLSRDAQHHSFFRYVADQDDVIHNANVLACAVLARAARVLDEERWLDPAQRALATTLAAQRPDGSWPYADGREAWADNFHTGYVLESLVQFPEAREQLEWGLHYWDRAFFLPDDTPKYFPERLYPIDSHCYAQAIETWLAVGRLDRAERSAQVLIEDMLDPSGYVHFQRRRFWTSKVPLVRWSTAPAFRALAGVLRARGDALDADSEGEPAHSHLD
jgi:hypothetical protein